MSLRVWLPLNGNLENKGLSNLTITNDGATVNANGKIGKCYSFDGTDDYLNITNYYPNGLSQLSIVFWCKPNTASIDNICLFRGGGAHRVKISANAFTYRDSTHSSQKSVTFSATTADVWVHVAVVYDKGSVFLYKNGVLDNSFIYETPSIMYTDLNEFRIGRIQSSSGSTYMSGKLNDFRIYDHALSPLEVKELSQGLVLHYPLNNPYIENTTNIYNSASGSSELYQVYPYNSESTAQYINSNWTSITGAYGNNKVTISMTVTNNTAKNFYFRARTKDSSGTWTSFASTASTAIAPPGKTTFIYQTFNWQEGMDGNSIYVRYYFSQARNAMSPDENFIINHIQVETKDHYTPWTYPGSSRNITNYTDNSGFGYDGIITGNLICVSDSGKYKQCAQFNGSTYITEPTEIITTDSTIVLWINTPLSASYHILDFRNSSETGKQPIYCYTDGKIQTGGNAAYVTTNTGLLVADTWVHVALVQSGNSLLVYKNGSLFQTISCTNSPLIRPRLGARLNGINVYNGKMSDFRVYTTALSEADIKALYNTSANVDNLGNFHSFEFVEDDRKSIDKNGITHASELYEYNGISASIKDSGVYNANEFIEK